MSSSLLTRSPVVVVVAPIRFTTTSWLTSGLPRQLLGIHGDRWLTRPELLLDGTIQVLELRIAIGMFTPLQCLLIGLQAVAHVVEQLRHHPVARLVPVRLELLG